MSAVCAVVEAALVIEKWVLINLVFSLSHLHWVHKRHKCFANWHGFGTSIIDVGIVYLPTFPKERLPSPCRGASSLIWVFLSCPTLTQFSRITVIKDHSSVFASMYCTQILVPSVSCRGTFVPKQPSRILVYQGYELIPLATEDCFSSPVVFFFFLFNGLLTKTLIFYSLNLFPLSLTILRISCFSALVCTEPALEIMVCTFTINQGSVAGFCSDF